MGLVARKPVFGVSEKANFKPVSSATETSYKNQNLACSKFRDDTFQNANNKGADQSARMRRLVWVFVVRKQPKTVFSRRGPNVNMKQRLHFILRRLVQVFSAVFVKV